MLSQDKEPPERGERPETESPRAFREVTAPRTPCCRTSVHRDWERAHWRGFSHTVCGTLLVQPWGSDDSPARTRPPLWLTPRRHPSAGGNLSHCCVVQDTDCQSPVLALPTRQGSSPVHESALCTWRTTVNPPQRGDGRLRASRTRGVSGGEVWT